MTRTRERTFDTYGQAIEDTEMTKMAREKMAISESEQRSSTSGPAAGPSGGGGSSYTDEEASATAAIPPLPQAKPIPGHSKAITAERMHAQATEPREAKEAMPATGNYGEVDAHAFPDGPEARKSWPLALLSGAVAAPVAALRLAGHAVSKVACKVGVLRQRGEEKWAQTRAKLKAS